MTYADKYALMKAYKIITGDDPDQNKSDDNITTFISNSKINEIKATALQKAINNKNIPEEKVKEILEKFGFKTIQDILVADYMKICNEFKEVK